MAIVGVFDATAAPQGWFQSDASPPGWFDKTLLSSSAASVSYTLTAQGGQYSSTGQQATITYTPTATGYTLTAQGGAYSMTGANAVIARNRKLAATGGSYSESGQNATLLRSKKVVASGGAYAYTGQQITITHTPGPTVYALTCLGGAYLLAGASATLNQNRSLTAQGGAYTAAGQSATVVVSKSIDARGSAGGRKAWHELTVDEVEQQWDLLDLRTKPNTQEIPEGSPPVAGADQNPVKNAGSEAARVSGPLNVAMPANYQGILTSSPTDSAGEPLAPDQAAAAIEARRQRNNKALAMLLMEL